MKIIFATNNSYKLEEIRSAVRGDFTITGLAENGIKDEIPETRDTLEGNAIEKAEYIYTKYGLNCFADDTGLEVEALGGKPGVYSARYAGPQCSSRDNVKKLLEEMEGTDNRNARFRTVIAFIEEGEIRIFEGTIYGSITRETHGSKGFGYDPVFLPENSDRTFAEMSLEMKNQISHRSRAVEKFVTYLSANVK
jgi:XTP/dITP diphosphohydrolase